MLATWVRKYNRTVNRNPVLGYQPRQLLCVSTAAGGGFVGTPSRLWVWVRESGWPQDLFPREEDFPEESESINYIVYDETGHFYVEALRRRYGTKDYHQSQEEL